MIIHWGGRYFGKMYSTKSGFSIATEFLHAFHVPIIPLSSYIIPSRAGVTKPSIKIPIHKPSRNLAYFRGFTTACMLCSLPKIFQSIFPDDMDPVKDAADILAGNIGALIALLGLCLYIASRQYARFAITPAEIEYYIDSQIKGHDGPNPSFNSDAASTK